MRHDLSGFFFRFGRMVFEVGPFYQLHVSSSYAIFETFELGCGFPVISALMRTVYKSKADSGFYSANPYLMIDEVSQ